MGDELEFGLPKFDRKKGGYREDDHSHSLNVLKFAFENFGCIFILFGHDTFQIRLTSGPSK